MEALYRDPHRLPTTPIIPKAFRRTKKQEPEEILASETVESNGYFSCPFFTRVVSFKGNKVEQALKLSKQFTKVFKGDVIGW
ncbi:hypothetical protein CEXT_273831 [Caerostris extrusa]|uniref:Uncharacterized protein n=1 Tax=Caerostris extrusa TaxID=172846 RepID=A0AAV4NRM1_CAEEX|nr:hypothetical protein CEXT_273831 [Caerostris extrusa]